MFKRTTWILASFATTLIASGSGPCAESFRYAFQVPDRQSVTFELDVEVRHTGKLEVSAGWSGGRTLSMKLIPPGQSYGVLLRTGLSPLAFEAEIGSESRDLGTWQLRIHSLANRGGGEGFVVIETPEAVVERPGQVTPVTPPLPPIDPWLKAPKLPSTVPAGSLPFLEATEAYRSSIVGATPQPPADVCRWQSELMRFLAEQRNEVLTRGAPRQRSTVEVLLNMVQAIDAVELMRTTDDPLVVGPPPSDEGMRSAWIRLRRTKVDPIEDELDEILQMVRNDYAAELEEEQWPIRFVSCVTACERYFEQSSRLGEERAANRELALSQWPRILRASRALAELAALRSPARREE